MTKDVAAGLRERSRDELRRAAAVMTTKLNRRVTKSEMLTAALMIAGRYPGELTEWMTRHHTTPREQQSADQVLLEESVRRTERETLKRLLTDAISVFAPSESALSTRELLKRLYAHPDRNQFWRAGDLTPVRLAQLLRPAGVHSEVVRVPATFGEGRTSLKGYRLDHLIAARNIIIETSEATE